ncbi:MAG: cation:proton antiporter [Pirellulaceae bacterium]
MEAKLLYYLAGVPLLGVAAQWLGWRLRLPSILLLLAFGMTLGAIGLNPDHILAEAAGAEGEEVGPRLLFPIVSLVVAIVLFEGGLTLRLSELRQSGRDVLRLCTIGVLVSWGLTAVAARWLLDFDWGLAALLGAILVVTGPTVIAPLLRHIQPERRVGSIVKWEGIVVDPIGAVLAVIVFEIIAPGGHRLMGEATLADMLLVLFYTVAVSGMLGLATGVLLAQLVRRYWIPDFLQGVFFLAVALGVFAVSNMVHRESGLVAVTVLGVYLANQRQASIKHVVEFKEHLVVLSISCLFIVLGSRLELASLLELNIGGAVFLAVMILVVRPASVFLATLGSDLNLRERTFLAALAPRGIVAAAVTSVFALELVHQTNRFPENEHLALLAEEADRLVPLTFLVIVGTVSIYGLAAGPLARWLKLAQPNPQGILFAGAEKWIRQVAKAIHEEGFAVLLVDTNYRNVSAARQSGLPAECASILSEHIREEMDLSGIGRLLALTPNDEVNALASREFAHLFGRANVFQLSPWDTGTGKRQSVGEHLRGRQLFNDKMTWEELEQRVERGEQIKKTRITEEFTFEDFRQRYGESAVVLFVIEEGKRLRICTGKEERTPSRGRAVIALVAESSDPATESKSAKSLAAAESGQKKAT